MAMSDQIKEATKREWRELGFFYDRDDVTKQWKIVGSISGLSKFIEALRKYVSDPRNELVSEHEHYGPYMYLEIGTWHTPEITDHWIAGPLADLHKLAEEAEKSLKGASEGDCIKLREKFSPGAEYNLVIEVKDESFDPANADPECR